MKFLPNLTTVFLVMLVVASFLCLSDAWRRRRRRRRNPISRPPPPPVRTPVRLPYCALDARVKIITQKRFGRELQEYKRGTTTAWPYNCEYASILKVQGIFNYLPLIHTCCNSCNFPKYSICIHSYAASASWQCPSEGLQCIVTCVRKHDPNTKSTIIPKRTRMRKFRVSSRRLAYKKVKPTIKNSKCERKVRKKGKDCIERLCIPIKLI